MLGQFAASLMMRTLFGRIMGHASEWPEGASQVTFRSVDGSALEGAIALAEAPRGVVVMCHPFAKSGLGYFAKGSVVSSIVRAGWHVVLFNFKGFGASELRGLNYGDDVVGVVSEVKRRFPLLPVSLIGLSFGGFHAASALCRLDGTVTSAFLDSVPLAPADFFRGPAGAVTRWLSGSRWAAHTGTRPLGAVLRAVGRTRLQLVYGERDVYCRADEVVALRGGPERRVTVLPSWCHLEAFRKQPPGYLELILETLGDESAARATAQRS